MPHAGHIATDATENHSTNNHTTMMPTSNHNSSVRIHVNTHQA